MSLGRPVAFLGTPEEVARNAFHLPPMHLACAEELRRDAGRRPGLAGGHHLRLRVRPPGPRGPRPGARGSSRTRCSDPPEQPRVRCYRRSLADPWQLLDQLAEEGDGPRHRGVRGRRQARPRCGHPARGGARRLRPWWPRSATWPRRAPTHGVAARRPANLANAMTAFAELRRRWPRWSSGSRPSRRRGRRAGEARRPRAQRQRADPQRAGGREAQQRAKKK